MREKLAELAHEQWSGWMYYIFSKSTRNPDGSMTVPAALVAHWDRQRQTCYVDLPEPEKGSDRREADRMIAVLEEVE